MEILCQKRALEAFRLNPEEWGVNVQPLSGSPANLYAFWGVLKLGDRIMALDLNCGGHLSHGFETPKKKVSATADYFEFMHYTYSDEDASIKYDEMQDLV